MNKTKIQLSDPELRLVTDREVILTKNRIIQKVYGLFGELADELREIVKTNQRVLPVEVIAAGPKIARGENYLGLPYVMLDYPRLFEKHNIFAVRMMFWWGNFFSSTLHLSGEYKIRYQENLFRQFNFFRDHHYYVCVATSQWHHHYAKDNYQEAATLNREQFESGTREKEFLKLSTKISLTAWHDAGDFFLESFKQMLMIAG